MDVGVGVADYDYVEEVVVDADGGGGVGEWAPMVCLGAMERGEGIE